MITVVLFDCAERYINETFGKMGGAKMNQKFFDFLCRFNKWLTRDVDSKNESYDSEWCDSHKFWDAKFN